jgi:hypothetical protein
VQLFVTLFALAAKILATNFMSLLCESPREREKCCSAPCHPLKICLSLAGNPLPKSSKQKNGGSKPPEKNSFFQTDEKCWGWIWWLTPGLHDGLFLNP